MISPRSSALHALLRGLFLFLLTTSVGAQTRDHAIFFSAGYLDASQIFLSPQSSDPLKRNETAEVGGTFSYAGGYRLRILPSVAVQFDVEGVSAEQTMIDQVGTAIVHGYDVWLLEGNATFSLPFSTEWLDVYVGGGGGVYVGRRVYSVAGVEAESVAGTPAIGIHLVVGAEYFLTDRLAVRTHIMFRDPQISVENRFRSTSVTANGVEYSLPERPFVSYINLNGNTYALGLSWYF